MPTRPRVRQVCQRNETDFVIQVTEGRPSQLERRSFFEPGREDVRRGRAHSSSGGGQGPGEIWRCGGPL